MKFFPNFEYNSSTASKDIYLWITNLTEVFSTASAAEFSLDTIRQITTDTLPTNHALMIIALISPAEQTMQSYGHKIAGR